MATTTNSASSSGIGETMVSVVRVSGTAVTGSDLTLPLLEALQWYREHHGSGITDHDEQRGVLSTNRIPASFPWQWPISNRYFSATIELQCECHNGSNNVATTTSSTNARIEDGVVLVFANDSPRDFDALASIHATLVEQHRCGDVIRLCLGMGPASSLDAKHHEAEYARRILWCLDHGYEYIEGVDVSVQGRQMGHEVRDKDGFARVVQALQSTVWSTATKNNSIVAARARAGVASTDFGNDQENCNDNHHHREHPAYEPPPTTLPLPLGEDEQQREDAAQKALLEDCDDKRPDSPHDGRDNDTQKQQRMDRDQEHALEQLQTTLKEANRIRDLSRAGQLSDQERRQRAGDAAVLLMNLMGMDDDDEEDDNSEEEQENDDDVADDEVDQNTRQPPPPTKDTIAASATIT